MKRNIKDLKQGSYELSGGTGLKNIKDLPVGSYTLTGDPIRQAAPPAKANDGGFSGTILGGLKAAKMGPPIPPTKPDMAGAAQNLSQATSPFGMGYKILKEAGKGALEVGKGLWNFGGAIGNDLKTGGQYSKTAPEEKTPLGAIKQAANGLVGIVSSPFSAGIDTVTSAIPDEKMRTKVEEGIGKYGDLTGALGKGAQWLSDTGRAMTGKAPTQESMTASRAVADYTKAGLDVGLTRSGLKRAFGTKETAAINRTVKELKGLEANHQTLLRDYVEKNNARGHTPVEDIAKTGILKGAVDKEGVIHTKGAGGLVEQYKENMQPFEAVVRDALAKEGRYMSVKDLEAKMQRVIDDAKLSGEAYTKAGLAAKREIAGLIKQSGNKEYIPMTNIHDSKVYRGNNTNYLNENGQIDKTITRALKEAIEENTNDVNVKALNAELSRHFTNMGYLERLDGIKVKGGRLGKYVARGAGTVIGLKFGPFGAIIGGKAAELLQSYWMKSTFNSRGPGIGGFSDTMKATVRSNKEPRPDYVRIPQNAENAPIQMGPKADTSGPIPNIFRPGFGMVPEQPIKLLGEGKGMQLPQSVRETNLGLDEVRKTVFGQSRSKRYKTAKPTKTLKTK